MQFIIGDLLTGRRIQALPVVSGDWSDELNSAGGISCTVSLRDPDAIRLGLRESAQVGKAFLAVVDDTNVYQAGPIWVHEYDGDAQTLTLAGSGMWSYFDHRMVLPVLAGRLPTDATTDTTYTAMSLQAIARGLVSQAQSWSFGNVPVTLPTAVAGTNTRSYRGVDLVSVGDRLRELTEVIDGPDVRFTPSWTTDRLGVQWTMGIGTPSEPLLFSPQSVVFNVGLAESSVSNLKVGVDGKKLGSQAYAAGGRASTEALMATTADTTLTTAGFAVLELRDASHATVSELATLQGYADALALSGRTPVQTWSFSHDLAVSPFLSEFAVGDFAKVRVMGDPYIPDDEYTMRITARSGDAVGKTVDLTFAPEVL